MGTITSIEEYRVKRNNLRGKAIPPARAANRTHQTPRASLFGLESEDTESLVQRLSTLHGELNEQILDILEGAILYRLTQIQRYGSGLTRRIEISQPERMEDIKIRRVLRSITRNHLIELVRDENQRLFEVRLQSLDNGEAPPAVACILLKKTRSTVVLAFAARLASGKPAKSRASERRPGNLIFWDRDTLDNLVRELIRGVFEEAEE